MNDINPADLRRLSAQLAELTDQVTQVRNEIRDFRAKADKMFLSLMLMMVALAIVLFGIWFSLAGTI